MTKRKKGGANGKPPNDESVSKPSMETPLPVPLPHAAAEMMPILDNLSPGPAAAEQVYRAAHAYALLKTRDLAGSEDETKRLLPAILAKIMVELDIPGLASAFAKAEDPNIFKMQLLHDIAVRKYRSLTRTP